MDFDHHDLINENKKVKISFSGHFIDDGIIKTKKINSIKKVESKTEWKK